MPRCGCQGEAQPGTELCAHHAVTAPCWTSPMDPCHHCHLQTVLLLMRLCHGMAIGMVSGHCERWHWTCRSGCGGQPSFGPALVDSGFPCIWHPFFCMFPYQKPLRESCAVSGILGAMRVEVVEGQHVSVPQLVLQTSRGTQLSAQQCAVFV